MKNQNMIMLTTLFLLVFKFAHSQSRFEQQTQIDRFQLSKEKRPVLILIDFQKAFDDSTYWGHRNNPDAESNAAKLLAAWRKLNLPIIHIRHCSKNSKGRFGKESPGNQFKDILQPLAGEPIVEKNVNSAFIGTDLKSRLESMKAEQIVITGLTTDHCVSTTTRMSGNYGFETYLVSDATATFDKRGFDGKIYPAEVVHETELAIVHDGWFATVATTKQILSKLE